MTLLVVLYSHLCVCNLCNICNCKSIYKIYMEWIEDKNYGIYDWINICVCVFVVFVLFVVVVVFFYCNWIIYFAVMTFDQYVLKSMELCWLAFWLGEANGVQKYARLDMRTLKFDLTQFRHRNWQLDFFLFFV